MFITDTHKYDTLRVELKITEGAVSRCTFLGKDFIVERLVVSFEYGHLVRIEATGPVLTEDGSANDRLQGESYLLGGDDSHDTVSMNDLPDWASDLPGVLSADPDVREYLDR